MRQISLDTLLEQKPAIRQPRDNAGDTQAEQAGAGFPEPLLKLAEGDDRAFV